MSALAQRARSAEGMLSRHRKRTAAAGLPVLLIAVAMRLKGGRPIQGLLPAPASAIAGLSTGTPQALATPTIFLQDEAQQIIHFRFSGHSYAEKPVPPLGYPVFLFYYGLGLSLPALLGIYSAVKNLRGAGVVTVACVALFLLETGSARACFTRNLTIIATALALLCGFGAFELGSQGPTVRAGR